MSCLLGRGEIIATVGISIIQQDRRDQPQTFNKESKRTFGDIYRNWEKECLLFSCQILWLSNDVQWCVTQNVVLIGGLLSDDFISLKVFM